MAIEWKEGSMPVIQPIDRRTYLAGQIAEAVSLSTHKGDRAEGWQNRMYERWARRVVKRTDALIAELDKENDDG